MPMSLKNKIIKFRLINLSITHDKVRNMGYVLLHCRKYYITQFEFVKYFLFNYSKFFYRAQLIIYIFKQFGVA